MKKIHYCSLIIILGFLYIVPSWAGSWTGKEFIYKPNLGARGQTEKNAFDAGMDRVDARLSKEIWVGDPKYGPSLQDAVAAIGANSVILLVPAGTHSINSDLTIPANVTLKVARGAILSIANGKTLTINGSMEAGPYQVFSPIGTGRVSFGRGAVNQVNIVWFGAVRGVGNDNSSAIIAALDSIVGCGAKLFIPDGDWYFSQTIKNSTAISQPRIHITGNQEIPKLEAPFDYNPPVKGSNLIYTGSGAAIEGRDYAQNLVIENIWLGGPGRSVSNSIGISVKCGAVGFTLRNSVVSNFDIGISIGTDADGNADQNYLKSCTIKACNTGVWFRQPMNFINKVEDTTVLARTCIRSNYAPVVVIGGWIAPQYSVMNNGIWQTTVQSVDVGNKKITLTNGSNLATGQFMIVKGTGYRYDGEKSAPYSSPLFNISGVSGNEATIDTHPNIANVSIGADVVYGNFPVGFRGPQFTIIGTHIEAGIASDGNHYRPIDYLMSPFGASRWVVINNYQNEQFSTDNLYNRLVPMIYSRSYSAEGTVYAIFEGNFWTTVFPKVEGDAYIEFKKNSWLHQPVVINSYGYFPAYGTCVIDNDYWNYYWGDRLRMGISANWTYSSVNKWYARDNIKAPWYGARSAISAPGAGFYGDCVLAANSGAYLGWKNTNAATVNGIQWTVTLTNTGSINIWSNELTVNSLANLYVDMEINIAGAGSGGANMLARILAIDGGAKKVWLHTFAYVTVTNAAITANQPTWCTYGAATP